MKKQAFTFAEILITLLIISLVAIGSTKVIKSKVKKSKEKPSVGMYACTIFDNKSYYYKNSDNNAAIPTDVASWTAGECGHKLVLPNKGIMQVTVIGAGGDGEPASLVEYDKPGSYTISNASINTTDGGGTIYPVPVSGWYDIEVQGNRGGNTNMYIAKTDPLAVDYEETARSGYPWGFKGTIYLKKGIRLKIESIPPDDYEPKTPDGCGDNCFYTPGENGRHIKIIKSNGETETELVTVLGSKAGFYYSTASTVCTAPSDYICDYDSSYLVTTYKYEAAEIDTGIDLDGSVMVHDSALFKEGSISQEKITSTTSQSITIKWSNENGTTGSKVLLPEPGRGGGAGEIKLSEFVIKSGRVPSLIQVGVASSDNANNISDTYFHTIRAVAGGKNVIAYDDVVLEDSAAYNGINGASRDIGGKIYAGGAGGNATSSQDLNGHKAIGFGAGGGGGAVLYSAVTAGGTIPDEALGIGASGGNGLIILRWGIGETDEQK